MNRTEYMTSLRHALAAYPEDFREEILEAFEGHFEEGLLSGQSEEEVIESLGSVREVMENIRLMYDGPSRVSDLESSFRNLSHSIRDTVTSAAGVFSEAIRQMEEEEEQADKGFVPFPETEQIRVRTSRSNVDVRILPGSIAEYHFQPKLGLFSKGLPKLYTSEEDGEFEFLVEEGYGLLTIRVPETVRRITCDVSSSDAEVHELTLDDLDIHSRSGDITVHSCMIQNSLLETFSGDVKAENTSFGVMNGSAKSGDIDIKRCSGSMTLSSASGDISAKRVEAEDLYAKTASGDADIEGIVRKLEVSTASGDIELELNGRIHSVRASSSSGDIDLDMHHDDFTASCRTMSGDIENRTRLPYTNYSKRETIIGNGSADIRLSSTSGDIQITA